jgi:hypothetical protein
MLHASAIARAASRITFRASSAAIGKSCRASRQKSGKIPADLSGTQIAPPSLSFRGIDSSCLPLL